MSQVGKPLVWMEGEIKSPPFSGEARIEAGMLLRRLQQGENIRDENKNWRIFYHLSADAIVILDVQNKATQKTPRTVFENCKRRLKLYQSIS